MSGDPAKKKGTTCASASHILRGTAAQGGWCWCRCPGCGPTRQQPSSAARKGMSAAKLAQGCMCTCWWATAGDGGDDVVIERQLPLLLLLLLPVEYGPWRLLLAVRMAAAPHGIVVAGFDPGAAAAAAAAATARRRRRRLRSRFLVFLLLRRRRLRRAVAIGSDVDVAANANANASVGVRNVPMPLPLPHLLLLRPRPPPPPSLVEQELPKVNGGHSERMLLIGMGRARLVRQTAMRR
jgi:hypothetical protein